MTTTITGVGAHVPQLFLVYDTEREAGNIITDLIGGGEAIVLRPAGSRRGTFSALFASQDDAIALEDDLAAAMLLELTDTDRPALNMTFAVAPGRITVKLDPRTRKHWVVSWEFREVVT